MRALCAVLCFATGAVGSCSDGAGKVVDGAPDLSQGEAAGSDVGYSEGDQYRDGPYLCCAKNGGEECCASEKQGFCFEYGGMYHACLMEGEEYEAKVTCSHCCKGLVSVSSAEVTSLGGDPLRCSLSPPSVLRCVYCGDGTCGVGENRCNCPLDCKT